MRTSFDGEVTVLNKEEKLNQLNKNLKDKVRELYNCNVPLVFGNGKITAKIVLIGEAPGKNEIEEGKPFVGQAGKLLDEFLQKTGIDRDDLYITNTVKLRPFIINSVTGRVNNRKPTSEEIELFSEFLLQELEIIDPKVIVTMGNTALFALLREPGRTIKDLHGVLNKIFIKRKELKLFPIYHPAAVFYNRALKEAQLADLNKLKTIIETLEV